MNRLAVTATVRRVLTQLRHDPRTIALSLIVPAVLMTLLRYVFQSPLLFDQIGPALLGIFPFTVMFLITSVTMLRERTSGTLERLLTTPMAKLDLLLGYGIAFCALAALQVSVSVSVSLWLGLNVAGSVGWLLLVALLNALLGVALGLLASAFARTEFQAVQFMPLIVLPQVLLCGLLNPRNQMASVLRWASDVLPLSYAVQALQQIAGASNPGGTYWRDDAIVLACALVALGLSAATLRRRTP
jgi:ABC-2 type transport system permease protein